MGVRIHVPLGCRYAFFNSPYPSHKEITGVDIYPIGDFGALAPSPVEGEVILERRVRAPKGNGFKASDHDTVIIIKNRDNPDTVTKLLHVDPIIETGEWISVGDPIGRTLRSGYYGWGTSPHVHVEIRDPLDPIRARGGYRMNLIDKPMGYPVEELTGIVVHTQPEYAMIEIGSKCLGLVGTINDLPAVLDGGIPYYGWLGAHMDDAPESGTINLLGKPIAYIIESFHKSCKAKCRDYRFMINEKPILGLSLTLWPSLKPLVKAIPLERNGLKLSTGDLVQVDLKVS
ncbi:peptidoglycan DD-metalloendopeptidase family protein [Candidatus Bathyarchaeota archaeon]|nr:peptidoglycan DD-metalloendopeptidase family protein [Candidatus Bathyarchaeota archaeon]